MHKTSFACVYGKRFLWGRYKPSDCLSIAKVDLADAGKKTQFTDYDLLINYPVVILSSPYRFSTYLHPRRRVRFAIDINPFNASL